MYDASALDTIDRQLLALLQANGRAANAELGQSVGLSVSAVNERVRKLSERGVITGVRAHVSPEALGLDLLAYLFVSFNDPAAEDPFLTRISSEGHVQECHHVTGVWSYVLKLRVANTKMLEALLANVIKKVPGVGRTETIIVLSSAKDTREIPVTRPDWM